MPFLRKKKKVKAFFFLIAKNKNMRPQQSSFKKGGAFNKGGSFKKNDYGKHVPTPGSTLPKSMQEELDGQGKRQNNRFMLIFTFINAQ